VVVFAVSAVVGGKSSVCVAISLVFGAAAIGGATTCAAVGVAATGEGATTCAAVGVRLATRGASSAVIDSLLRYCCIDSPSHIIFDGFLAAGIALMKLAIASSCFKEGIMNPLGLLLYKLISNFPVGVPSVLNWLRIDISILVSCPGTFKLVLYDLYL
jgi:hypothetical protein